MIAGSLPDGRPQVDARIVFREVAFAEIFLWVDTGAGRTVISTGDVPTAFRGGLPMDDAVAVEGVPGVAVGLPRAASLVFVNDAVPHQELAEVFIINGEPGASRLGRDILSRWLMVYDQPEDLLFFAPHET